MKCVWSFGTNEGYEELPKCCNKKAPALGGGAR